MNPRTDAGLVKRLKNAGDQPSWREFFERYRRLIFSVALKAGLTEAEAQDAVQETLIAVSRKMPGFEYVPGRDSFKGWLLQITRWKIADQFRKRLPRAAHQTTFLKRVPDNTVDTLDALWENEWRKNRLRSALDRIRRQVDPKHYRVFELLIVNQMPPQKIAEKVGISADQVHLIKFRLTQLLKREIRHCQTKTC